jgi:alkylated DNA repair dioxygenase AlkB
MSLLVVENFVSPLEEKALLELISKFPGNDRPRKSGPSRMIRFGELNLTEDLIADPQAKAHGYSGKRRSYATMNDGIDAAVETTPLILEGIAKRLVDINVLDKLPPIYVINKYPPGYKISPHTDHPDNGPTIPVVAIGSDTTMVFTKGDQRQEVEFKARSLVSIGGDLRYNWKHEILPCKELRYSIVFRNLPK